MSPRHFARAFQAETGLTPAKAVEKLRVEAARAARRARKRGVVAAARGERMRFRRRREHAPQLPAAAGRPAVAAARALTRRITDATSASHRWVFP
nr:hypothetical protein [Burkholderia ubonensis]